MSNITRDYIKVVIKYVFTSKSNFPVHAFSSSLWANEILIYDYIQNIEVR